VRDDAQSIENDGDVQVESEYDSPDKTLAGVDPEAAISIGVFLTVSSSDAGD